MMMLFGENFIACTQVSEIDLCLFLSPCNKLGIFYCKFLYASFIEIKFTCFATNPFTVYNSLESQVGTVIPVVNFETFSSHQEEIISF
jgi:hypothetical protein